MTSIRRTNVANRSSSLDSSGRRSTPRAMTADMRVETRKGLV
jgi:hypothetical protein